MKINFYPVARRENMKYVVIVAEYKGKCVYVRHKKRETWEVPGGHIEQGETPEEAGRRELREETGAVNFNLTAVADFRVGSDQIEEPYSRLFHADIQTLGDIGQYEIAEIQFNDTMPENLTYPHIQPTLKDYVVKWKEERQISPSSAKLNNALEAIHAPKMIDIASGSGEFLQIAMKRVKDLSTIVAYDISKKGLEHNRQTLGDSSILYALGQGDDIPFIDGEFDLVTVSNSLHHFENPEKVLSECIRILKTGGTLVVNELICDGADPMQETFDQYHGLAADIDLERGVPHYPTWSSEKVIEFICSLSLAISDSFIYEGDSSKRLDKEVVAMMIEMLDKRLELVLESDKYPAFVTKSKEIKIALDTVGVREGKQIAIIGKKL